MRGVREEPFAYERIEVIKGANSTLFGVSDPGGSVNFVIKQPRFERLSEVYVTGGSYGHVEYGFDFGDTIDAGQTLALRLTGKLQDSDLEYDHSRDDETFLMGGLTWEPTDATTLTVVPGYLDRDGTPNSGGYPLDREYDRGDFFGEPGLNHHEVERTSISGLLRHDFGGGLSLSANLRYSDLSDDFGYVFLSDTPARVGTIVDRYSFGTDSTAEALIGNAILQYDASSGTIVGGFEYRNASISSRSFYSLTTPIDIDDPVYSGPPPAVVPYAAQSNDYDTKSLFLQQNLSFDDRIVATVGVRHDGLDLGETNKLMGVETGDGFSETSVRGR